MGNSAKEIVNELTKASPTWSQNGIAAKLGISSQAMSNRMQASDIKVGFFADILDVLDYDLVAVPQSCQRLPRGSVVVGRKADE